MAMMKELKEKANEAAQNAAKTAKYVAFISKCRLSILNEQDKIRHAFTRLGKVYYKDYVTDEEPDEAEYKPLCDAISASFMRINDLKQKMAEAKAECKCTCDDAEIEDEDEEESVDEATIKACLEEITEEAPEEKPEEASEEAAE